MHNPRAASPMTPPVQGQAPKVTTYPCACGKTTTVQFPVNYKMPPRKKKT